VSPHDSERLIHAYLDRSISDDELERLNEAVLNQPEVRELFWRLAEVDQTLYTVYSELESQEAGLALLEELSDLEDAADAALVAIEPHRVRRRSSQSGVVQRHVDVSSTDRPQELFSLAVLRVYRVVSRDGARRSWWAMGALATAAMLLVVIGLYRLTSRDGSQPSPPVPSQPLVTDTPGQTVPAPAVVASVTDAIDVDAVTLQPGATLLAGEVIVLPRGLMQVVMQRGARVLLHGPCEVTLVDDNTLKLHHGRLAAYVPQQAKRFTVDTPTTRVIDLGTEFGVEVASARRTEFHVFDGSIEVETKAGGRRFAFEHDEGGTVDDAGRLDRQPSPFAAARYWRSMPTEEQYRLVTESTLALWRFDTLSPRLEPGDHVPDLGRSGLHLRLETGALEQLPGRYGMPGGVQFVGPSVRLSNDDVQRLLQFGRNDSFTLEAFVRISPNNPNATLITRDVAPMRPSWWWRVEDGLARFMIGDGVEEPVVIGRRPVNDGRWHHLAAVRDAVRGELRLYINGELDGITSDTTRGDLYSIHSVQLGRFHGVRRDAYYDFQFHGDMAMVRISRGALEPSAFAARQFFTRDDPSLWHEEFDR